MVLLDWPPPDRRCWTARPALGERSPSRLMATAAEGRLNIRRRNSHTSFAAASGCETIAVHGLACARAARPSIAKFSARLNARNRLLLLGMR